MAQNRLWQPTPQSPNRVTGNREKITYIATYTDNDAAIFEGSKLRVD